MMTNKLFPIETPSVQYTEFPAAGFSQPACGLIHRRKNRPEQGMPLGAIDTGYLGLEADGTFGFCSIFNSITPLRSLKVPFLGITVGEQTWVLHDVAETQGLYIFSGIQTPTNIHYWGHYPVADLEYEMPGSPVSVGLRAFSPLLPGDTHSSNTPGVVFEVHLRNLSKDCQKGRLAFSFPGPTHKEAQISPDIPRQRVQGKGESNFYHHYFDPIIAEDSVAIHQKVKGEFSGIFVTSEKVKENGYALGVIGEHEVECGGDIAGGNKVWQNKWKKIASGLPEPAETDFGASVAVEYQLKTGEEKTIRFVLSWYAPWWIGEGDHTFRHMYSQRYKSALEVAQFLSRKHIFLLKRILAWQEVIYAEKSYPVWLREGLVNILHLLPINSLWAMARPPIGPWCESKRGLFGLIDGIIEDPAVEPIPDSFIANMPLVYFFPDLALSTLYGYKAYQFPNGAACWVFGGTVGLASGGYKSTEGTDFASPTPGYQTTTNGCCLVGLIDRYLERTGDKKVLEEFYPAVKKNTIYTMNLRPEDGADGIISVPSGNVDPGRRLGDPLEDISSFLSHIKEGQHLEWFEWMLWFGMTPHVGGMHLAQLQMAKRMAEKVGDQQFVDQCCCWIEQGSSSLEKKLWAENYYLAYSEPATGRKSDDVFANQLDGQWIAKCHGLSGVFRGDRVKTTLETIKRLNVPLAPTGAANLIRPDGSLAQGVGYGPNAYFPPFVFILAMTYMYEGDKTFGLELARRCQENICVNILSSWNQPNIMRGDNGDRLFGSHYAQNMMLWAIPTALEGKDIASFCAAGGIVDRIMKAANGSE